MMVAESPHDLREGDDQMYASPKPSHLFLDANLGHGKTERLTIFKGDDPEHLAHNFAHKHSK
jgi:hypothetical protein